MGGLYKKRRSDEKPQSDANPFPRNRGLDFFVWSYAFDVEWTDKKIGAHSDIHIRSRSCIHMSKTDWLTKRMSNEQFVIYFIEPQRRTMNRVRKKNWRSNLSLSDCQICVYLLLLVCLYVFSSAVLCRQCLKHANENAQWWKNTASTSAHIP